MLQADKHSLGGILHSKPIIPVLILQSQKFSSAIKFRWFRTFSWKWKSNSIRKACMCTSVCDTTPAVRKFIAYKRLRTPGCEILYIQNFWDYSRFLFPQKRWERSEINFQQDDTVKQTAEYGTYHLLCYVWRSLVIMPGHTAALNSLRLIRNTDWRFIGEQW